VTDPLAAAAARLAGAADRATLERVTLGDAAVLVELGTGAGLAHRPPREADPPATADAATLLSLATDAPDGSVERALGVATCNALSAPHIQWRTGDPMALVADDVDTVVTVGLFRPAFRKFADVTVRVIERDPVGDVATPAGVTVEAFTPDETATAMTDAEVVFLTGSAFVYGGATDYLAAVPADATVVVVGATASFLPVPLFAAGVDVVAGAAVTDPATVRAAAADGACGTDLHDAGVRKVYVAASETDGRLTLDTEVRQ
jgi:hypothetical protein